MELVIVGGFCGRLLYGLDYGRELELGGIDVIPLGKHAFMLMEVLAP